MTPTADGAPLYSIAHPRPHWLRRVWFWYLAQWRYLFGFRGVETAEIEISQEARAEQNGLGQLLRKRR